MKTLSIIILLSYAISAMGQLSPVAIDSLEAQLANETDDSARVDLLNRLSLLYYRVSLDTEEQYAYEALTLAQQIGYVRGEVTALKNIGIAKRKKGAPLDTVLHYYRQALDEAEAKGLVDIEISCLNNMALALSQHELYHAALKYMLQALDIETKTSDPTWKTAMIIANVGTQYYRLGDYDKALEYYERSRILANENGWDHINLMHVDDIAMTKYRLGNYTEAEDILKNSIDEIREEGDFETLYQTLLALSDILIDQDRYEEAEAVANSILTELKTSDFPLYRCGAYYRLTDIYLAQDKGQSALEYSQKSMECAEQKASSAIKMNVLEQQYEIYDLLNEEENKDLIHREYVELIQYEIERRFEVATEEVELKYENQVKAQEVAYLKEKQKSSNRLVNLLWAGIISTVSLSFIATLFYRKKNKLASQLQDQNNVLHQRDKSLEERNKQLKKYIESNIQLEQFAHIASHDLKSPLRTVNSFIGLTMNSAKDRLNDKEKEYMTLSLNAATDMYQLVEDLLSYSKVNALELEIEEVDAERLIAEVMNHLTYSIKEKSATINLECNEKHSLRADRIKLRQVIENLMSNALKFMPEGKTPVIHLRCEDKETEWQFVISDNGIGIDKEYSQQVFEPFTQLNQKGTYAGTGLGLALCKRIVEKHKGRIWIESVKDVGSSVYFTIAKDL